jgi:hypothetical protein
MSFGYSAAQLARYYRWCIAHPDGQVVLPGGRRGWDEMSVASWFRWFRDCLTRKVTRGTEGAGKGNRAKRRAAKLAADKATCDWCGQARPAFRSGGRLFCEASCARAYAA